MKRFSVEIEITECYEVFVDAENEYDADDIASELEIDEIRNQGEFVWHEVDIPLMGHEIEKE